MLRFYGKKFFAPENEEGAESEETEESSVETEEGTESEEGDESDKDEEGTESEEGDESDKGEGSSSAGTGSRETRVQRLANEARKEREARIRVEAERDTLKNAGTSNNSVNAERVRAEKLALMTPEEKREYLREEEMVTLKQSVALTNIRLADTSDKTSYDAKAARNPIYAKHADKVEQMLADMRKNGTNAPRETLLDYIIGKEARMAAESGTVRKKVASDKKAAADRVSSAKGSPMSARSDVGNKRAKDDDSIDALRERIEADERRRGLR